MSSRGSKSSNKKPISKASLNANKTNDSTRLFASKQRDTVNSMSTTPSWQLFKTRKQTSAIHDANSTIPR